MRSGWRPETCHGRPVAPTPASLVAAEFLSYLQIRKGLSVPGYLQPPEAVPDGWETYMYRLQLHGRNRLPPGLRRLLALRVYAGPEGLPPCGANGRCRPGWRSRATRSPGRC